MTKQDFSKLPQVHNLVESNPDFNLIPEFRISLARKLVAEWKTKKLNESKETLFEQISIQFQKLCKSYQSPPSPKAINATGVVLHTNLGRAPLPSSLFLEMAKEISGYSLLEFDRKSGERGSRTFEVEDLLCHLIGCESALVVNNNAAAVFLVLMALSTQREVLISRGELVQIGGGFRIPDILEKSGAILKEIGTTNITKLKDYEKGINKNTSLILKVHQSNFTIKGHTEEVELSKLSQLAKSKKIPLVVDLGSGSLEDRKNGEKSITSQLRSGASLVTFSGDKLLGSSQAGIIVGETKWVKRLKTFPLYRALRLGKLDLFTLRKTLLNQIHGVPSLTSQMIGIEESEIRERAESLSTKLKSIHLPSKVVSGTSSIGGGTTPKEVLNTALIEIEVKDSTSSALKLSALEPAIIVRKATKKIILDLRTVLPEEEETLLRALQCLS